jgi:hypothetical protein
MLNRIQKMTPASERYLGNLWTAFGSVKRIDAVNGWVAERRTTTDDHGDSVRAELEPTEAGHMTSFRSVEAEKVEKRVSRVVWCLSTAATLCAFDVHPPKNREGTRLVLSLDSLNRPHTRLHESAPRHGCCSRRCRPPHPRPRPGPQPLLPQLEHQATRLHRPSHLPTLL